jgi:CheY-like chemotaxis protein
MSRILVADDTADIAQMWALKLSLAGYDVLPVTSGCEAVRAFQRAREAGQPFALLLLDLAMPGMNGFQAAAEIRRIDGEVPIRFVTAFDEPLSVGRASEYGADVWAKPVEDLEQRVAEVLGE